MSIQNPNATIKHDHKLSVKFKEYSKTLNKSHDDGSINVVLTQKEKNFLELFDDDICITRDQNGRTFISKDLPTLNFELGEWENADFIELERDYFNNLSWERAYFSKQLLALAD